MDEAEIPVTSYGWIQHDPSITGVGAVRTRMPEVQIRFEGYLIRETAGFLLGTPPPYIPRNREQSK